MWQMNKSPSMHIMGDSLLLGNSLLPWRHYWRRHFVDKDICLWHYIAGKHFYNRSGYYDHYVLLREEYIKTIYTSMWFCKKCNHQNICLAICPKMYSYSSVHFICLDNLVLVELFLDSKDSSYNQHKLKVTGWAVNFLDKWDCDNSIKDKVCSGTY